MQRTGVPCPILGRVCSVGPNLHESPRQRVTRNGERRPAREATMLGLLLAATVLASEPPPPTPVLEVNGAATKLDALGPVVVGKDGSLGLISGWAELSPQEKEAGLAQVTRRNAKRFAQLKQEEAAREEAERRRGPVPRLALRSLQPHNIGIV